MSAPSWDEQPLPTAELQVPQLRWLGVFTAHGLSRDSRERLQPRGPRRPWEQARDGTSYLLDLNDNILKRRFRRTHSTVGGTEGPGQQSGCLWSLRRSCAT